MNGNPNKKQRDWHEWLINNGCAISSNWNDGQLSIHHIGGSKMKIKGVDKPGEWYCICLSYWHHQDGNNKSARHINKHQFEKEYETNEKELFIHAVKTYVNQYGNMPMTEQEYNAIVERA